MKGEKREEQNRHTHLIGRWARLLDAGSDFRLQVGLLASAAVVGDAGAAVGGEDGVEALGLRRTEGQ